MIEPFPSLQLCLCDMYMLFPVKTSRFCSGESSVYGGKVQVPRYVGWRERIMLRGQVSHGMHV